MFLLAMVSDWVDILNSDAAAMAGVANLNYKFVTELPKRIVALYAYTYGAFAHFKITSNIHLLRFRQETDRPLKERTAHPESVAEMTV